ncbi:hypothetical protein [Azotobacter beijerinckii]|uniref:hypothetical protein n=1 Tax=Azotobacter beijerinckii TaxID=170623 RepID=UPI0029549685|nr:hypothetical protein [Azotobacter beijerinckii]MDV7209922.1 hypothetical protein [Azotobacter beijerinckii]
MVVLFVLAVFVTALPGTSELLTATANFAEEGIGMVCAFGDVVFKAVTSSIAAIWCSCLAAGAVPRSI